MKLLAYSLEKGDVRATVLSEAEDVRLYGGVRGAIEACIRLIAREKELDQFVMPRVTRMEEKADGATEFDFDAAVAPAVELGQYLGLEVYVPADERPDLPVLRAAAESLRADIPETYISRKTDALVRERMDDIFRRTAFGSLADMYAILRRAAQELDCGRSDDELWDLAVSVAGDTNGGGLRLRTEDDIVNALGAVLFPDGTDAKNLAVIQSALEKRAEEKRGEDVEKLARESFDAYLRLAGKTEEGLRQEFREQALELVRIDLLIDEVARREKLTLSDEEFDAALNAIANMYDIHVSEVLEQIGAASLRAQLIRDKARAMIVDSANTF